MRILAISDIHNNVACVRKLRAQESNDYDVIAVPGDIGTHRAAEIFEVLRTFRCPVVYVHGNWDRMPASVSFGRKMHLIHLRVVEVGGLAFVGYSFDDPEALGSGGGRAGYLRNCRIAVAAAVRKAGVDPRRCVLMAHDRATHLDQDLPGLLLHLYGHVHTFEVMQRVGTTYVNVSALDRLLPVRKAMGGRVLYVNAGNYAVISLRAEGAVSVECRLLDRNYAGWTVVRQPTPKRPPTGVLIPEDRVFGDNIRFPQAPAGRRGRGS